jgi:hypothetical protein
LSELPVRPHHAIWPSRMPRQLTVPDTTLGFNLEVSARRFPAKEAYSFLGRTLSFAELHRQSLALAGWLQCERRAARRPGAAVHAELPAVVVAFYGILRADAVVVPVNPMNRVDEFGHYITDPQAKRGHHDGRPGRHRGRGQAGACGAPTACTHAGHPFQRRHARCRHDRPDGGPVAGHSSLAAGGSATARLRHALAGRPGARTMRRPAEADTRRPGGAALYLRHHRACRRAACTRIAA